MSTGPIEFLGEGELHEVPVTEYGGNDGLIQPGRAEVGLRARADGMEIGHDLDASEINGVMSRAASEPVLVWSGNEGLMDADVVVDPHTGRALDSDDFNKDVSGKPGKEHGLGDNLANVGR